MKLSLAPIQGMTLAYYRNLYNEIFGGIDTYYSPFIATTGMRKSGPTLFKDILPEVNDPSLEIIPQLLGNNPGDFKYFASRITDLGYNEINWNIGCPYPMVTKKKKGSGILPYPDMIRAILDEACKGSYDLTVKMRLGLEHLDEGPKIIEVLNDYPLKGVTIHGRTGHQMYTGHVDLDAFETLYKASKHEITYNGDIFTVNDFKRIQERFPDINNFMLARGALRDPFLPAAIKGTFINPEDKILKIKKFHDTVFTHYASVLSGDKHLADKMKEFWTYLEGHIDPTGKFMKKVKKCTTITAYKSTVDQALNTTSKWIE